MNPPAKIRTGKRLTAAEALGPRPEEGGFR